MIQVEDHIPRNSDLKLVRELGNLIQVPVNDIDRILRYGQIYYELVNGLKMYNVRRSLRELRAEGLRFERLIFLDATSERTVTRKIKAFFQLESGHPLKIYKHSHRFYAPVSWFIDASIYTLAWARIYSPRTLPNFGDEFIAARLKAMGIEYQKQRPKIDRLVVSFELELAELRMQLAQANKEIDQLRQRLVEESSIAKTTMIPQSSIAKTTMIPQSSESMEELDLSSYFV